MRTSLPVLLVLAMLTGLSACASKKPPTPAPPPKPLYAAHTATLDVTEGIRVIGVVSMPPRFAPNPAYAPLWLQQGSEVGIVGNADGKMTVLGFSGPELGNRRVISEDFGVSAPGGRILDIAASSDGLEIATAVAEPTQNRLEVILRDAINAGGGQPLASISGSFDSAQLTWLDAETLALILPAPALSNEQALAQGVTPISGGGLYVITVTGQTSVKHLNKVGCPLSRVAFSPNRYFAISEGDTTAPPVIVDVQDQTCRALALRGPIKMLAWAPDSNAFLYAASIDELHSTGVFRFDLTTGRSVPTAVSSGAAAYAGDGTVVALGNSELSWKRIAANPNMKAKAQIALFDPHQSEIKIDSLGFETTPTMLAQSTMAFSTVSDDGAIDTAIPGMAGALREVIEYSYPARAAFVLAAGGAQGPLMMSWSPDGKMIAFVDGNSQLTTLTVIAPPR